MLNLILELTGSKQSVHLLQKFLPKYLFTYKSSKCSPAWQQWVWQAHAGSWQQKMAPIVLHKSFESHTAEVRWAESLLIRALQFWRWCRQFGLKSTCQWGSVVKHPNYRWWVRAKSSVYNTAQVWVDEYQVEFCWSSDQDWVQISNLFSNLKSNFLNEFLIKI